jgi:hypothetical protein
MNFLTPFVKFKNMANPDNSGNNPERTVEEATAWMTEAEEKAKVKAEAETKKITKNGRKKVENNQ